MKKVLPIIFILAVIASLYLAYTVISSRHTTKEKSESGDTLTFIESSQDNPTSINKEVVEEEDNIDDLNENSNTEEVDSDEKTQFTTKDCSNECSNYENGKSDFKYCKQLCGFLPVEKKENKDECESLSGSDKDFCLRDLAVTKKDFEICKEIEDKLIKDMCNNRITEEIFDESQFTGE